MNDDDNSSFLRTDINSRVVKREDKSKLYLEEATDLERVIFGEIGIKTQFYRAPRSAWQRNRYMTRAAGAGRAGRNTLAANKRARRKAVTLPHLKCLQ